MDVDYSEAAAAVARTLSDHAHDRLWDVLDKILDDPDDAPHAPWASYVSSFDLWGSKIPGTDYTVFWRIEGQILAVHWIVEDRGL